MAKGEFNQVVHCGAIVTLNNGKGKCPKCHANIEANFKVEKAKRSFKKVPVGGLHDKGTLTFGFGALLLMAAGMLIWNGIQILKAQGLMAFDMGYFTMTIMILVTGLACMGVFSIKVKKGR